VRLLQSLQPEEHVIEHTSRDACRKSDGGRELEEMVAGDSSTSTDHRKRRTLVVMGNGRRKVVSRATRHSPSGVERIERFFASMSPLPVSPP